MPAMRAAVALLAALTLVTACGGSDTAAGPASSAGLLKPGAVAYWQTVSDPDSEQWEQVEDLLKRFPDGDQWIAWLERELENQDLSWEEDVRPALGSVVDVVIYPGANEVPTVVGLTDSKNEQKLVELVAKLNGRGDDPLVTRTVDDWVAISTSQGAIDRALKEPGDPALADDDSFRSALDELPDDALSRIHVDPARAMDVLSPSIERVLGLDGLDFAGAWAKAHADGPELALSLRGAGVDRLLGGEPYASELVDKVPDDAFAFLTFQGGGLREQLDAIRQHSFFSLPLSEFEREYGFDLDELASLLDGEVAFYVRPGVPTAEFTALLDTDDAAAAEAQLRRLVDALPGDLELSVGSLEGAVVVSTAADAVEELRQSGGKLPDSDRYSDALDRAEAPDEYTGLVYVDLTEAAKLITAYTGPEVDRNLEPLQTFVAFATKEGDSASARAFLEID